MVWTFVSEEGVAKDRKDEHTDQEKSDYVGHVCVHV